MSSLRILTYNISWEAQTGKDSAITFGSKCIDPNIMTDENEHVNICRENVKTLIKQSNADIILLQEVGFDIRSLELSSDYKYQWSSSGQEVMVTIYNTSKLGERTDFKYGEFSPGRPFHILIFDHYVIINLHRGHDHKTFVNDMTRIKNEIHRFTSVSRRVIIGGDFNTDIRRHGGLNLIGKDFDIGIKIQTQNTCCTRNLGREERDRNYEYLFDYIGIDEKLKFELLTIPISTETNINFSDHLPVFAIVSKKDEDILNNGIVEKYIHQGTRLYRGTNLACNDPLISNSIRNYKNEWFSQYQPTSLTYTPGCLFAFETTRPLRLINLWTGPTMKFVVSRYQDLTRQGLISEDENLAFKVFSGYGLSKGEVGQELPAFTLAKSKGWAKDVDDKPINRRIELPPEFFPNYQEFRTGSIKWKELPWGTNELDFNRTSTYKGDEIVMDTLRDKIFIGLNYDGVYCSITPSSFHKGLFEEEFIIFKDANAKLGEIQRADIRGGSISSSRRLPFVPKRKDRSSSSSSKKRYTRRRRALRSGRGGYRPRVTGRKV